MPTRTVQTLMNSLIDYAGLFPPAKLDMETAVRNYASYLRDDDSWMLGRFICPVSRFEQFRRATEGLLPRDEGSEPWRLSAIIDGDLDENIDAIFAFNHEHEQAGNGLAEADAIELRAAEPGFIDEALDLIPEELFPFFEITLDSDVRGHVAAIAGNDAAAKIRTGGVTADAFPSCERVAAFIVACAAAQTPFKATAGLHHPVRSEHRLTYEADAPTGMMHGFLNVFLAAAMAREHGLDASETAPILEERQIGAFALTEEEAGVGDRSVSVVALAQARETFALSYGSCSFTEPVEDLRSLGML